MTNEYGTGAFAEQKFCDAQTTAKKFVEAINEWLAWKNKGGAK